VNTRTTTEIAAEMSAVASAMDGAFRSLMNGDLAETTLLLEQSIKRLTWARIDVRELHRQEQLNRTHPIPEVIPTTLNT
jgi:hypothetical protein